MTYRLREWEVSLLGWLLLPTATNLRERMLCRLIKEVDQATVRFYPQPEIECILSPLEPTAKGFLDTAYTNGYSYLVLHNLPMIYDTKIVGRDPELPIWLQDLAYILAQEANDAATEEVYPGIIGLDPPVEDGHVELVIEAMQRELDREARSRMTMGEDGNLRPKVPLQLNRLTPDRQRALVERRRYWYARFGIGLKQWQEQKFSLWDVDTELGIPPQLRY